MAMMRRGPLDRFPVEWVLRQASTNAASGTIEFHTERPTTVFVRAGQVCLVRSGIVDGRSATPALLEPEERARARSLDALAAVVGAAVGWYYLDPLGAEDLDVSWGWNALDLLAEAQRPGPPPASAQRPPSAPSPDPVAAPSPHPLSALPPGGVPAKPLAPLQAASVAAPALDPLGSWAGSLLALRAPSKEISLPPDAWEAIVALATVLPAADLGTRLGWPAPRLVAALDALAAGGVVVGGNPEGTTATGRRTDGRRAQGLAPSPDPPPDRSVVEPRPPTGPLAFAPTPAASGSGRGADAPVVSSDLSIATGLPAAPSIVAPPSPALPPSSERPVLGERRGALRRLIDSLRPA